MFLFLFLKIKFWIIVKMYLFAYKFTLLLIILIYISSLFSSLINEFSVLPSNEFLLICCISILIYCIRLLRLLLLINHFLCYWRILRITKIITFSSVCFRDFFSHWFLLIYCSHTIIRVLSCRFSFKTKWDNQFNRFLPIVIIIAHLAYIIWFCRAS